jgi:hypothetical protein
MINDRRIDQAFSDLRSVCGGVREDYFGLLYLEQEHNCMDIAHKKWHWVHKKLA